MKFRIVHTTQYEYSAPAIECYSELRVRPRNTLRQVITDHVTEVVPRVPLEVFVDYWGNWGESLSVPFRHQRLSVTSRCTVETRPFHDPIGGLDLSVSEAAHLCLPKRRELYDFLMPSELVQIPPEVEEMARVHLPPQASFTPSILALNEYIYRNFKYQPGATTVSTPVAEVIAKRRGVCQDFAHLFIAVLRAAGIPARYVSGYIETESQAEASQAGHDLLARHGGSKARDPLNDPLVGATASHAWLEFCAPNGIWVGIDPTNNMLESERHVQIGIGRDYADVPPLRGVFKGARKQVLSVKVTVARTPGEDADPAALI
ncbi:MAG: transglutaminase family protein [Verrucomicrobium sp.]|nr:transglutaminase family protein [Verrucomicrobium sp.]